MSHSLREWLFWLVVLVVGLPLVPWVVCDVLDFYQPLPDASGTREAPTVDRPV